MSSAKGKFAEVAVFRYLLGLRYEVYIPIIDTGVDFIIEPPTAQHRFIGVQVKTSSFQPNSGWWLWTISKDDRRKFSSFYYILVLEDEGYLPIEVLDTFADGGYNGPICFVIPYDKLDEEIARRSIAWTTKGEFSLSINRQSFEKGKSGWLKFLMPYLNNWNTLRQWKPSST